MSCWKSTELAAVFFVAMMIPGIRAAEPLVLEVPDDPNGYTDILGQVTFSPDGKLVATTYGMFHGLLQNPNPGQAVVWDATTGKKLATLKGHADGVSSVDFSPTSDLLATSGFEGLVNLWKIGDGYDKVATWRPNAKGTVTSLEFSPDGRSLAVGTWADEGHDVIMYRMPDGQETKRLKGHTDGLMDVTFSPDGQLLAGSSMDATIRIWDVATAETHAVIDMPLVWAGSLAFSPDGKFLAAGRNSDLGPVPWDIRIWETTTWKAVSDAGAGETKVTSITYSPDGKWLAVAQGDFSVLRDTSKLTESVKIPDWAYAVAFSPDGSRLAVGSRSKVTIRTTADLLSGAE